MPDCVAQESEYTGRLEIASFHTFLREYMELLKRNIQNFSSGEGVLYRYKVYRNGKGKVQYGWYSQDEVFFSKYHLCVDYCKKHECCEHVDKIMITRITIDKERKNTKEISFVLSHIRTWNAAEMNRRGFREYECPDVKGWDEFDKEVAGRGWSLAEHL